MYLGAAGLAEGGLAADFNLPVRGLELFTALPGLWGPDFESAFGSSFFNSVGSEKVRMFIKTISAIYM